MSLINVNLMADSQGGSVAPISSVMRNRIQNGAMTIDQRNAGASVTADNTVFAVDRFRTYMSQSSKGTIQQNAGAVTPPAGFRNYLGFTSTSSYSVLSSDHFVITQYIEGFNTADLMWGTANAQTVTLSFLVRSSLTGTFGGSIQNSAFNRAYPFSYTISAANTWEQKSITIAGDTGGTWVGATNGIGMRIGFGLGVGATLSGTAGAWAGSNFDSATGATSVVGTNGATFFLTGVQLEKGTQATGFEYRQIGTELALCQRYFETSYSLGTAVGTATYIGCTLFQVSSSTQTLFNSQKPFAVQKRATPTMTYYNPETGASGSIRDVSASANLTANGNANAGMTSTGAITTSTSTTANNQLAAHYIASSEL